MDMSGKSRTFRSDSKYIEEYFTLKQMTKEMEKKNRFKKIFLWKQTAVVLHKGEPDKYCRQMRVQLLFLDNILKFRFH